MNSFELIATPSEFARKHLYYPLLAGFDRLAPSFYFEREYYPAYELIAITNGRGGFRHGGVWMELAAGDCLLHNMRIPHAYRSLHNEPFEMRFIVFDGWELESLWTPFTNDSFIMASTEDIALNSNMEAVIELMRKESNDEEIRISSLLYELVIRAFSSSVPGGVRGRATAKPQHIEAVRDYLDKNFLEIASVKEAADHVKFSPFHLGRQFKHYYGVSPKEYLLQKRIHYAKRQLLHSDNSIISIATASGFPSYNAFLHSFLRIEQCSPTDYRKNNQRRSF